MEGMDSDMGDGGGSGALEKLTTKLNTFLSDARSIFSGRYLLSLIQLCHMDTQLAYSTWVDLFPRLWSVLSDRHRQVQHGLQAPLLPFGCRRSLSSFLAPVFDRLLQTIKILEPRHVSLGGS